MLGILIIGPDKDLAEDLYRACAQSSDLSVYRTINEYPRTDVLARLLNSTTPHVVFLDLGSPHDASLAAREIQSRHPQTAVMTFARSRNDGSTSTVDGADGDTLYAPFRPDTLRSAIVSAIERCTAIDGNTVAFLPAKAGSGASTTALNVAGSLAHYWRQNVLLIETDLHSGCLSVALQVEPAHTIVEVLAEADELRERSWARMTTRVHGLDALLAARGKPGTIIAPWQYQHLLAFAGPRYDTIVADLPEVVNEATQTIVRHAAKVYVVGTPEVPSLFLARRRLLDLERRGVPSDRLGLVLNRVADDGPTLDELEQVVERPIAGELPNDYQLTIEASRGGRLVEASSFLGRAYASLAQRLVGADPLVPLPSVPVGGDRRRALRRLFKRRGAGS